MPKARPAPKAGRALAMMAGMDASNDHSHTDYAAFVEGLDVPCRTVEHAPLFTVQDGIDRGVAELMGVPPEHLVKNLLLRDTHGDLYLVVALGDTRLDLKGLARALGSTRLSFAPAETMRETLGAAPGCASMLGLLHNPHAQSIHLVIDEAVAGVQGDIGFAAGGNTRTVLFPAAALPTVAKALCPQDGPRVLALPAIR